MIHSESSSARFLLLILIQLGIALFISNPTSQAAHGLTITIELDSSESGSGRKTASTNETKSPDSIILEAQPGQIRIDRSPDPENHSVKIQIGRPLNWLHMESPRIVVSSERIREAISRRVKSRLPSFLQPEQKPLPAPSETVTLKSQPCATREKASDEALAEAEKFLAQRLSPYNLTDPESVRGVMASMKLKPVIVETSRTVGGEIYPIYTGIIQLTIDQNFDRHILRQINRETAQWRFDLLLGAYTLLAIVIFLVNRFMIRSRRSSTNQNSGFSTLQHSVLS